MSKLVFLGDIFIPDKSSIPICSQLCGDIVYNQEHVIGNSKKLKPVDGKVNLINSKVIADKMFPKANKIYADICNNHINDYGYEGVQSTKNLLLEHGINVFGADDSHIQKYRIGVHDVVFLGYYMNAFTKSEEINQVISKMEQDISSVDECRIFVCIHFGNEHFPFSTDEQRKVAHAAIDFGAEMVIGHHPHNIQDAELYKSKYIFYSLGNFYFPNCRMPAFYENGVSKAPFMWRNTRWTKKALIVQYDLDKRTVVLRESFFSKRRNDFMYRTIDLSSLKRNEVSKKNSILGECRNLLFFIYCNIFVGKWIINIPGIKVKFKSVIENGRIFKK